MNIHCCYFDTVLMSIKHLVDFGGFWSWINTLFIKIELSNLFNFETKFLRLR